MRLPSALLASLCGLLASCASEPTVEQAGRPPEVELGPVLELLPLETSGDRVETLIDGSGRAHVIIAAEGPEEIHHVTVSPDGGVQRELIRTGSTPRSVSAAFDGDGRLHVLLDGKHLVREASTWSAGTSTPWDAADVPALEPSLVQAPGGLLWAFTVDGKEVGAKGRWEWYAIGGAMGAFVFPWHSSSLKRVLVPEAATTPPLWYVLDPQDNLDTSDTLPAVDARGNLHVVYDANREGIGATYQLRYARTALVVTESAADQRAATDTTGARKLVPVHGDPIPVLAGSVQTGMVQATSAVDPATGMVLIVRAHEDSVALEDGQWGYPLPLPLSTFWGPKLAAAGANTFHLVTTADQRVLYLHYANDAWSSPLELGRTDVRPGNASGALDVASDAGPRAFVVWPTSTGIVGRWVDARNEIDAATSDRLPERREGPAAFPGPLLDFARGKAELITPGVVTGLSAAMAAGGNSQLTKELHDAGQWEALATVVLKDNYGDDLRWYFLGRAAEGMALCDAAERYYRISLERSESFLTRCLSFGCAGFKVTELLAERAAAVAAMRAEGKCTPAPP